MCIRRGRGKRIDRVGVGIDVEVKELGAGREKAARGASGYCLNDRAASPTRGRSMCGCRGGRWYSGPR